MVKNRKSDYKKQALKYLSDAEKLFKVKDYAQSSEKFWGATVSLVKTVAEKQRLVHNGHHQLFKVVDVLSKKTGDSELNRLFRSANALHINFYENWLTPSNVIECKRDVEKLIRKLEKLLV